MLICLLESLSLFIILTGTIYIQYASNFSLYVYAYANLFLFLLYLRSKCMYVCIYLFFLLFLLALLMANRIKGKDLTDSDMYEIIHCLYARSSSQLKLAKRFQVAISTISQIYSN